MKAIYILTAFAGGWLTAQLTKLITAEIAAKGKLKPAEIIYYMVKSGGMPSGHTASFLAASMMIGYLEGFGSPVFALALACTVIIVYDATNVRYAVGQQGKLLNEIAKKDGIASTKPLKVVEGHTIPEAAMGALAGVAVASILQIMFGI